METPEITEATQQPEDFPYPIHVLGAGSVGGNIVLMLAKLGFLNITAYDFDIVEQHNVSNQVYGRKDIGKIKVEALSDLIFQNTGTVVKAVCEKFTDGQLSGIVFLAVDSMEARKQIWKTSVRTNFDVRLLIEIRMSKESGIIFAIHPNDTTEINCYEKNFYNDSEVFTENACSMRGSAPLASSIDNHAVFQLLNFMNFKDFPNEVIIVMPAHYSETNTYKKREEE